MVAVIGEQTLGPTDVSLSNWTVRPSSGCSVVLATHTAGVRAPLCLPLPARHGLQLRCVRVRGRQRLRPVVRQLCGRSGRLEHGQDVLHRRPTELRSCTSARTSRRRTCPTKRQERWTSTASDPGRNPGGRQHKHSGGGHGGLGALLKHKFLDGGADDVTLATLGKVLLEPTLTTLGNFLVLQQLELRGRPASRWEASSWRATP